MQKTKTINNKDFKVAPFTAVEGLRLKSQLLKIFGPAIGELLAGNSGNTSIAEAQINGKAIAGAIEQVMSALSEEQFIVLIRRILQNTICTYNDIEGRTHSIAFADNFDVAMNEIFQCELFSLYPVLAFVLEVNYPDFFTRVLPVFSLRTNQTDTFKKDMQRPTEE